MKRHTWFKSSRVSARVILAFLGLVLFQGLVSVIGVSKIISRANEESFENQMRRTVESVQVYTDDIIREIRVKTSLLAGQKNVIDYADFGLFNLLAQELSVFRPPMRIDALCVLGHDSGVLAASGEPWVIRLATDNRMVRNYLDGTPVFLLNVQNRMYLWVVSPILRDKTPIAYLAAAVQMDRTFLRPLEAAIGARVMLSLENQAFATTGLHDTVTIYILERYYREVFTSQSEVSGAVGSLVYRATVIPSLPELYAYCFVDTGEFRKLLNQYNFFSIGFLLLVVFLALALALVFYQVTFFKPLGLFMQAVQSVAGGDLAHKINARMEDEFGDLALAFENMVEKIGEREQRIKELGSYNELILANVPAGILTFDLRCRLSACNEKILALLGRGWSQTRPGMHIDELDLPGELRALLDESFQREQCAPLDTFREIRVEANGRRILSATVTPLLSAGGSKLGTMAVLIDVTKEKALEERLSLSSRMAAVGEMVAGVAHQIRNPLAVMKVSVDLLKTSLNGRSAVGEDETRKLLGVIVAEMDSLGAVVSNFLDFTRPFIVSKRTVDVAAFIRDTCALLPLDGFDQVRLRVDVQEGAEFHSFDPSLIGQALANVVMNAFEASHGGQEVRVNAARNGRRLVVTVKDEGPGMPEHIGRNAFEPFYTTKQHGTGLGLSIAHRIVESHGGSIDYLSVPGRGTAFILCL